ncbi:MAG: hypothetical protein ACO29Z_04710 [Crocinitomicaceae bacterium]|jgi:hypothetical protein
MSEKSWKIDVLNQWESANLEAFCKSLNISFQEVFLTPLRNSASDANPFEGLVFEWMAHSQVPLGLLHLYPVTSPSNRVTWEEWFIKDGELHHHVLRNYEHQDATDQWFGDDSDHPSQVCNIQWYYKNDSDLRPVALR